MPMYPFKCDACGHVDTHFCTISQYTDRIECPQCEEMMHRTYEGTPSTLDTPFHKPIEMFSVAPNNPAEVAAFRKANPNVQLNSQLVPIARTRAEKLQILKSVGFEEKN